MAKLKHLIIALILIMFILFITSSLTSIYHGYSRLIIEQSLEQNRVYAEKLAHMVNLYLEESLQTLEYSAQNVAEHMDDQEVLTREVNQLYNIGKRFNSVIIANNDGLILAGAPEEFGLQGQKIASKQGLELLENKKPDISDPYMAATGKRLITISQPIFSKDGKYQGLINGTIYVNEHNYFHSLIDQHFYQDGSYVYVVDSTGKIIFHRDENRINENVSENEVVQHLLKGESGAKCVTNSLGMEMIAGYKTVDIAGWGIVAQTPKEMALKSVDEQVMNIFLLQLPLLILSVIISIFSAGKIAQPLQSMAEISEDSIKESELGKLKNLKVWYYEAFQLKNALVQSFSFLHSQLNFFMDKSTIDPLTGLTNRRTMDEILQRTIANKEPISIIMLDIDFFKKVNDTFGHAVGDEVLKFFANEMKNVTTRGICCRYGGEEFIILLPKLTALDAYNIAERLRKIMEKKISPCGHPVTFSAGVASYPNHATTVEDLIKQADKALYVAKQTGRNKVVIAHFWDEDTVQ